MDQPEPNINTNETYVSVPLSFIEAVAHIGVDFGSGSYELEAKWIDLARRVVESEAFNCTFNYIEKGD